MGASIAFHLAEAGVDGVLLLERGDLAGGSTSKAAGGVRAQFSDPVNIALGMRGLDAFERFGERPGQAIDLHQPGYLLLYTDPESAGAAEASVRLQNSMGVPSVVLSAARAAELSPAVSTSDVLLATFHARDGYCSPESVVQGYASGARRYGAVVRTGVEVTGIAREGRAITAVETTAGHVRTSAVVCASGPWSRTVGAMAGIDLPVDPLRRQIMVTEPLGDAARALLPDSMPMTIDAGSTFYLHREGPGVLFGMSYRGESTGFHESFSDAWTDDLVAAMERRCPALLDIGVAHRWAGLYEVTPDDNALLGESDEVDRLLYACGFSGHGFLMGPAVGEVIRDLWLGREPVVDISAYGAGRFRTGALVTERNII